MLYSSVLMQLPPLITQVIKGLIVRCWTLSHI